MYIYIYICIYICIYLCMYNCNGGQRISTINFRSTSKDNPKVTHVPGIVACALCHVDCLR